jgi:hypothetical protein
MWLPRPIWRRLQMVRTLAWVMLALLILGVLELRTVLAMAAVALAMLASAM